MNARRAVGSLIAAAAAISLAVYVATWLFVGAWPFGIWPFFLCTAMVFMSGAISAQVLKPHYRIDRTLQIPRLKPYFSDGEYKSIWAAFVFTTLALFLGMAQISSGTNVGRVTLQIFTACAFGFLYTDALILLRAKFPPPSVAASEA